MILERTAAYVLAVVCVFQTLCPSVTIRPEFCRSIDIQIGRLRMQANNEAAAFYFDGPARKGGQNVWLLEKRKISMSHGQSRDPKRLSISVGDSGWLLVWLDWDSHE
jgi:hypothetical protein